MVKYLGHVLVAVVTFIAPMVDSHPSGSHTYEALETHPRSLMSYNDRFSASELDYIDWVTKMVDEGKMYWPNQNPNETTSFRPLGSFSLSNIACGFLGGTSAVYNDGENRFCKLVSIYAGYNLLGAQWILNDVLCQDNDDCTFMVELGVSAAGGFIKDGIPSFCAGIFSEIWNSCSGGAGGSATIEVSDSYGSQTAYITAQFYTYDPGATCPAQSSTFVCGTSLGN